MLYRSLGKSGLKVSAVGLGCNNFGMRCDAAQTRAVVDKAVDLGITLFDTTDVYSAGQSEELLGKALGARRKEVVIATKFGAPMGQGEYMRGGSRRYVRSAVDASLKRLGTDWIDLYQLHFPDPSTPLGETVAALDDLVREGKILYAGCSNYAGWQLVESLWIAETRGCQPYISAQNHYNLLERGIERDLVPAAEAHGVGLLPYFPLASGLLTGKYKRGETPRSDTRLGGGSDYFKSLLSDANFDKVERLTRFAEERGKTLLDLAFGWLLAQPTVSSVIAGATKPEQVEANVEAGGWMMTPEEAKAAAEIAVSPPGRS
ncbi:MAG TPA: aldo/keto reductase [Gammaproteobacteria bacterium]|nr:aldo/keto reductase [Gammaproteobacteria bacterium]